jgi:Zn-dependent membrane protease YugP
MINLMIPMGGSNMVFLIIFGGFALISYLIQRRLKNRFEEFSKMPTPNGLTGAQIAKKMLHENGIDDVKITSVDGYLTDHYNPLDKTVNLSPDVYNGSNVSAAAVAAHECGHAVQHARAYSMLMLRSRLVPVVQFSSNIVQWILLGGVLLINVFPALLLIGILLFTATTIFSLITLPVEFDASKRALAWLETSNTLPSLEHEKAKSALGAAAMTYVVAALTSLATLFYYVMIYMGGRRRD